MPLLVQNVPEACAKCLSFHSGADSATEPKADAQRGISVRGEIEVRAGRQEAASMWLLLGLWDKEGP